MLKQLRPRNFINKLVQLFVQKKSRVQLITEQKESTRRQKLSRMLISVDGNISSGKSTLVSKLVEHFTNLTTTSNNHLNDLSQGIVNGVNGGGGGAEFGNGKPLFELEVIPEPLDKWCNLSGHNLLELFYKDPQRYNFVFQHYVQLTRLMDTIRNNSSSSPSSGSQKIRIMERSLQNNRHCFLELARKNEQLQSAEFNVLVEWYNWLEANMDLDLDLVIYLRTSPEVAYSRMQNRGRAEESTCPFNYLAELHETYEDWLIRSKTEDKGVKIRQQVIVIDADKNREEVASDCVNKVMTFLAAKKKLITNNGLKEFHQFSSTDKYII